MSTKSEEGDLAVASESRSCVSDRELLEFAALAAGYAVTGWDHGAPDVAIVRGDRYGNGARSRWYWMPLTDDGDAFRLAVKLRLDVMMDGHHIQRAAVEVTANTEGALQPWASETLDGGDPYAATRLAIVRASAGIGRQMQTQMVRALRRE